jgi:hypothetical protein
VIKAERRLETADALYLARIPRQVWNDMLGRGFYTEAPPTTQGAVRGFDRDDIAALVLFDHLVRMDWPKTTAAKTASAFRKRLRTTPESVHSLWIVSTRAGEPPRIVTERPSGDIMCHEILVGDLRRNVFQQMIQKIATAGRA